MVGKQSKQYDVFTKTSNSIRNSKLKLINICRLRIIWNLKSEKINFETNRDGSVKIRLEWAKALNSRYKWRWRQTASGTASLEKGERGRFSSAICWLSAPALACRISLVAGREGCSPRRAAAVSNLRFRWSWRCLQKKK